MTKPTLTLNNLKDIPSSIAKRKLADYVEVMPKAPTDKAIALQIVNAVHDKDIKAYAELVGTIEGRAAMKFLNVQTLELAAELGNSRRMFNPATLPKGPNTMLTPTALKYLTHALNKNAEPLHPNFRRSIRTEEQLQFQLHLRATCGRIIDTVGLGNPRLTAVEIGKALKTDARAYVQFFKNLATDAAFAAHMDCLAFTRSIDADAIDHTLDSMIEDDEAPKHPITSELPVHDRAAIERDAPREAYAGGDDSMRPEPIADDELDAVDAIERLQAWLGLSVTSMKPEQREYWGVDGLFPLGQRREETELGMVYTSIHDFDEYCTWATEQYKQKRRRVPLDDVAEQQMLAA